MANNLSKHRQTKQRLADAQFLVKRDNQYLAQENGINHWVAKDDPRATILLPAKMEHFLSMVCLLEAMNQLRLPPKGYVWSPAPLSLKLKQAVIIRFHPIHWKSSTNQKQIGQITEKRQFRYRRMAHQMKKSGGSFPKQTKRCFGGFQS